MKKIVKKDMDELNLNNTFLYYKLNDRVKKADIVDHIVLREVDDSLELYME